MTKRFILLFGLMICAGAVSADPLVDGTAETGQQKAAACAACHGPKGNMQSDQFPKLAGQGAPYIYEQLKLFKSGDRQNAIMAGQVAGLNDQDMKDIAAYFAAQQTRPGASDATIAPAGATLYHAGKSDEGVPACSGCHGPSGLGNSAAKFPRLSGQNPQYIVTQLKAYRDGNRSGYRNATIMNAVAEELTDKDIQALASYVAGLGPAAPGTVNDKGALMQNGGPAEDSSGGQAKGGDGNAPAKESQNSDTQPASGADAATKEEAGTAGGTEGQTESAPAQGTGGVDDSTGGQGQDQGNGGAPAANNGAGADNSDGNTAPQQSGGGTAGDAGNQQESE